MRAFLAATTIATLLLISRSATSGPLSVWGVDLFAHQSPPTGNFVALAAGGALQTLAIRADGTLFLSSDATPNPSCANPSVDPPATDLIPPILASLCGRPFIAVGMGRTHALAIRPDGSLATWGTATVASLPLPTGHFVAVAGGFNHSVALDTSGHVVVWGAGGVPAPTGVEFIAIAARASYTVAVSADGDIYGWGVDLGVFRSAAHPWTETPAGSGYFIAPREPGTSYTAVSAGLGPSPFGLVVALRADGSVVVWDPSGVIPAPPVGTVFTQIAAGLGYWVGIDQAGHLHAEGGPGFAALTAFPAGTYSAVSAATQHATAIAGSFSLMTSAGPANVWLGLKNSDDVGTKFDLRAEILSNGHVVGTGELDGVAGGSSGFNNAVLRTINIALPSAVNMSPAGVLSVTLKVRIAASVAGHRSGTARLWFNDAAASSRLNAMVGGSQDDYYLLDGAQIGWLRIDTAGSGPRSWIDVFVDRAVGGNPFKPFGTWSVVVQ